MKGSFLSFELLKLAELIDKNASKYRNTKVSYERRNNKNKSDQQIDDKRSSSTLLQTLTKKCLQIPEKIITSALT